MKVLIAYEINASTDNPFVEILYNYFVRSGIEVVASVKEFWDAPDPNYDIIHFHWPEEVVGWNVSDPSVLSRLRNRIGFYKAARVRFVYTRHNSIPHYGNPIITEAYKIIEESADVVIHMAKFSCRDFLQKYPGSANLVIPHHIYEEKYAGNLSQQEARKSLGIPSSAHVVLSFGKFRNWEEVKMVLKAFLRFRDKNTFLLAPRLLPFFDPFPAKGCFVNRLLSKAGYHFLVCLFDKFRILGGCNNQILTDAELELQLTVADTVFIQRKKILNSGNLPLAFLFGKVVIGPDVGNVGEILKETGNPVFDPINESTIVAALSIAKVQSLAIGKVNLKYAQQHWSIDVVGGRYLELYKSLIEQD
jgi:glycosyltransferase involved in cell wall biosynthesis